MNKTENKDYSPELISDAEKILEVYAKLPDNKKPMLMVIMNALITTNYKKVNIITPKSSSIFQSELSYCNTHSECLMC